MSPVNHLSRLYGLILESPFPLPGAITLASNFAEPDVIVRWEPETAWREILHTLGGQEDCPRFGKASDGSFCIEFKRAIQFVICPENHFITVVCPVSNLEFAPTVLVGIGMGLLLHRRGVLCLHGSVISINGRTFALLGESGAGKSTMAAALVARGGKLVSDDLAAVRWNGEFYHVEKGCANLRLEETAKNHILGRDRELMTAPWIGKMLWDTTAGNPGEGFLESPPKLDAIYSLGVQAEAEGVRMSAPLAPKQAMRELIGAWYPQGSTQLLTQERLNDILGLAQRIPVAKVSYPRRWDVLPQVVAALIQ